MTNKEIISEIVNDLRTLQVDDRISERYVLSKLRYYNALFLKRENDQLRLFYDNNIWTTIDCLEMEEANMTECTDVGIPKYINMMRSVMPIPEIYSYKNGPIIREVTPLDGSKQYMMTTPQDYLRIMRREYRDPRLRYYWFQNGHLIIPELTVLKITMTACFISSYEAKKLNSCAVTQGCPSTLDDVFPCPSHLQATVKQETLKDLFNFYKRNIKDEVADLDSNKKTEQQNAS